MTKPFNLEAAKAGAPIETRSGIKCEFIAHVPHADSAFNVIILKEGDICVFDETGISITGISSQDLVMSTTKIVRYLNFHDSHIGCAFYYETEDKARNSAASDAIAIAVRVEFEQ